MSRDKQISEMVEDLYDTLETEHIPFYVNDYLTMQLTAISKQLIAKGYRKSQDVAEEIFAEIEKFNRPPLPEAKPVYVLKADELAELKKKYTGEDINVTTKTEGGE
jgi:hypothetical protein